MAPLRLEDRNPEPLAGADVFHKRQVQRRCRKGILAKPPADGAQQASIVEIQMGAVAKQLELFESRFSNGFQQIYGYGPAAMNLRRDPKLHDRIVQDPWISNPKSEISNWTVQSDISDFGFDAKRKRDSAQPREMQDSSNFQFCSRTSSSRFDAMIV